MAKWNLGYINLNLIYPVVSMICGVAPRDCLAMCLHVSSSCHTYSCMFCWSFGITNLDRSLLWSSYLQFACSVKLCGSRLWSPILPIQHPALPTPQRKWFMVGIGSCNFLHWSVFSVIVLIGGHLQSWFLLTGLLWILPAVPGIFAGPPTNLWWHQFPSSSIGNEFKKNDNTAR